MIENRKISRFWPKMSGKTYYDQQIAEFIDRNGKKNSFSCLENISKQFDLNYKQTAYCYKATLAPEKGGDPLVGRIAGNSTLSVL